MKTIEQKNGVQDHSVILIVEDNPVNQLLLRKKITQAGIHSPMSAKSGREAIALALKHNPDLILMDIQLPDMNGLEVIRSLRKQKFAGPIVAISADDTQEDRDNACAAGANGFIAKPIDFSVFFPRINEFLPSAAGRKNPRESKPGDSEAVAADSPSRITPSVSKAAKNVFISDAKEKLQIIAAVLEHAGDESQMERIKAIAHEYKGNAGYFGLHELERIARELDMGFKNDERPETLKKLTGQLAAEIGGIIHNENT